MIELQPRYDLGGDEFIFVELAQEMSLEANFRGIAITQKLREQNIEGIIDICPSNASYMVRINPDMIHPHDMITKLKAIDESIEDLSEIKIHSRAVDVPIWFEDPWTHEAVMRFRDRHQDPNSTDLEYAARINGYHSKTEFIEAITSAPFIVSMVGFVPGLPFCFQVVSREKQIEVPKYVRPRTFTPERTFGFGGAFAVIYPVQGAGGYQMFGIAPAPVYSQDSNLSDFRDSIVFPKQTDLFRYRAISKDEYDSIRKEVEAGTFQYKTCDISFTPDEVIQDPDGFSESVMRRLYND